MKIAAVTEDGVIISQHFGHAPYYVVLTVEDGRVAGASSVRRWLVQETSSC
jgi:predicted Fe-Mo cluster-binding NifX family protein